MVAVYGAVVAGGSQTIALQLSCSGQGDVCLVTISVVVVPLSEVKAACRHGILEGSVGK